MENNTNRIKIIPFFKIDLKHPVHNDIFIHIGNFPHTNTYYTRIFISNSTFIFTIQYSPEACTAKYFTAIL